MFWRVHRDAGSKVMSNVRLALEGAGGKFSFFHQFFVCCVGRKGLTLSCHCSQKSFVINVCLVILLVKSACQKSHTTHLR